MMNQLKRIVVMLLAVLFMCTGVASAESFGFLPTKEYNGQTYQVRPEAELTTVLLIGFDHIDHGAVEIDQYGYSNGGQSDFLLWLVFDHKNETIHRLQLDRDSMTPVKVWGQDGTYYGAQTRQLCLSHAYGHTLEENNANAIWAVENLLGVTNATDGVGVDWYMTMDISGINKLNEILGGVTVPIEDDFSKMDTSLVQGTTVKLTGTQAETYVRGRMTVVNDPTNKNRMARQRHYMTGAAQILKEKLTEDINFANTLLNEMGIIYDKSTELGSEFGFTTNDYVGTPVSEIPSAYLMTNESMDRIVSLLARVINYELLETETLPGEHTKIDGYAAFLVEEGSAEAWVMDTYYVPVN
ncbi:MAG: LCP family protein [Clostridia bacterium]|nr:LCP family protein [Clostridia bacterium]